MPIKVQIARQTPKISSALGLLLITIIHLGATIRYIFIDNSYEGKSFSAINKEANPRIYFQQFLVMAGVVLVSYVGLEGIGSVLAIVVFIVVKTIFEILLAKGKLFKSQSLYICKGLVHQRGNRCLNYDSSVASCSQRSFHQFLAV